MRTQARTVASALTVGLSVVLMGCASNATKRDAAASGAPTTASPTSTTSTSSSVESGESGGSTATSLAPDATPAAATTPATAAPTIAEQPATTTADAVASVTADAAVAGDIPDDQAFIDVTSDGSSGGAGYAIRVPEGWARADGAGATVFSDKFNTIRIETAEMATAPTVGSVRGDELPAVASSAPGYRAGKVVAATRKAGAVIVATYSDDLGRERGDAEDGDVGCGAVRVLARRRRRDRDVVERGRFGQRRPVACGHRRLRVALTASPGRCRRR